MKLNGSQALWECLSREGVKVVFGITGGAIMSVYHELPNYPIRHVTMRHEQAAAHAADGYARATGKVGVCMATSGPGATNLVTGIATAYMDSSPIVAITGQVPSSALGTDAFQEADITGITMPITKHNYLLTDVKDLPRVVKEAFYIARTGRPGPVLIDIAKNVQMADTEFEYPDSISLPGYEPHLQGNMRQVRQAAEMINKAQRPLLLAGRGVIVAGAEKELRALAEKAQIPVVTTLLGKSSIPETHELCLGMGGMHGEAYVNHALQETDVIIGVGARFDDRLTSSAGTFAPKAKIIHIDISPAEIGKRIPVDLPIVGDAKNVLRDLLPLVRPASHEEWLVWIEERRADTLSRDVLLRESDKLLPQYVIRNVWELTEGQAIMVSDVGQNQMWEAQYYFHQRFGGLITSGGLGTMGFGLPAAVGVAVGRPECPVWVVAGDGGFQMTCQELTTVVQERLPLKIVILNNGYLGMVRQWQELFFEKNYSATRIVGPDFARLAEAYGVPGRTVKGKAEVTEALQEAQATKGPILIDFHIEQEHNVFPIVPAGDPIDRMLRRPTED
ncbi:MAG: biosynthetic-type acetolactate synthase large subunit [Chloroflexota bacterium]|nr:biosynthetic-type acetolactate synthase large subunit [Chloroflexota bacterium]